VHAIYRVLIYQRLQIPDIYYQPELTSIVYSYCTSPIIHSFPTRRSSDLGRVDIVDADDREVVGDAQDPHGGGDEAGGDQFVVARSEEHTSELQSRENLVCRLLLEKKKTTIVNGIYRVRSKQIVQTQCLYY